METGHERYQSAAKRHLEASRLLGPRRPTPVASCASSSASSYHRACAFRLQRTGPTEHSSAIQKLKSQAKRRLYSCREAFTTLLLALGGQSEPRARSATSQNSDKHACPQTAFSVAAESYQAFSPSRGSCSRYTRGLYTVCLLPDSRLKHEVNREPQFICSPSTLQQCLFISNRGSQQSISQDSDDSAVSKVDIGPVNKRRCHERQTRSKKKNFLALAVARP